MRTRELFWKTKESPRQLIRHWRSGSPGGVKTQSGLPNSSDFAKIASRRNPYPNREESSRMPGKARQSFRRPATKLPHLRKKMAQVTPRVRTRGKNLGK
jgi:hypothetical protein